MSDLVCQLQQIMFLIELYQCSVNSFEEQVYNKQVINTVNLSDV